MSKKLELDADYIKEQYLEGKSTAQIAKEFNCSDVSVGNLLKKLGTKIRSPLECHKKLLINEHGYNFKILDENYIKYAYLSGKSMEQIAKELSCSSPTISKRLKKLNVNFKTSSEIFSELRKGDKNPRFLEIDENYIKNSYLSGKSATQIAKEVGCSYPTIYRRLRKMNIKIKSASEAQIGVSLGEKNPAWRGGISFLPYCHKFNKPLKEEIRELFGRKCYICKKTEKKNKKRLDVHHCDFNKQQGCKGNLTWKLLPLCKSCHAWTTNNRHEAFTLLVNYWAQNPEINFNPNL